jgi:hypothetical protein
LKRIYFYIILALIATAVALLLFTGDRKKKKKLDDRVTLRKEDKIPYGAFVAYQSLKHIFPVASVSANKNKPGAWDSLSNYRDNQALIIVSPNFYADEYEVKALIRFIEAGNNVFVSTKNISSETETIIRNKSSLISSSLERGKGQLTDSLSVQLFNPPFAESRLFSYKGDKYDSWFYEVDTTITDVLGTDEAKRPDFIHLKAGKGHLYVHLAPLTFSNYFLLQGDNMTYYENVLSVIDSSTKKIVWDEYYLNKKYPYSSLYDDNDNAEGEGRGFLTELFGYEELKWALLTAILALLLYVLLEMRRKQRFIPIMAKPRNDSLDFVKTIGRLYYDKGDHKNLCRKMGAYFLEHVRNKYKLPTGNLDEEFVRKLQFKTGVEEGEIKEIVSFISYLDTTKNVSSKQLTAFHKRLETFYQKA